MQCEALKYSMCTQKDSMTFEQTTEYYHKKKNEANLSETRVIQKDE